MSALSLFIDNVVITYELEDKCVVFQNSKLILIFLNVHARIFKTFYTGI